MTTGDLGGYVIHGGATGKARLAVLSRVLAPAMAALLDRCGPLAGAFAVDAGCGGGDVAFALADRVGATGRVLGFDLDEVKLAMARDEARGRGLAGVTFRRASVLDPWPAAGVDLAIMRFVLTHLAEPQAALARARDSLAPGGVVALVDIDTRGRFCDPPSAAFDRFHELYDAVARRNGGDPAIGARLGRLLEAAGFVGVEVDLAQPFGRSADVKAIAPLTLAGVAEAVTAAGLATATEIAALAAELEAFAARPEATVSLPRIFLARGRKPQDARA